MENRSRIVIRIILVLLTGSFFKVHAQNWPTDGPHLIGSSYGSNGGEPIVNFHFGIDIQGAEYSTGTNYTHVKVAEAGIIWDVRQETPDQGGHWNKSVTIFVRYGTSPPYHYGTYSHCVQIEQTEPNHPAHNLYVPGTLTSNNNLNPTIYVTDHNNPWHVMAGEVIAALAPSIDANNVYSHLHYNYQTSVLLNDNTLNPLNNHVGSSNLDPYNVRPTLCPRRVSPFRGLCGYYGLTQFKLIKTILIKHISIFLLVLKK